MLREKHHRLSESAYCGRVVVAFTICAAHSAPLFNQEKIIEIAHEALSEAFVQYAGHAGVYVIMPDHLHLILSGRNDSSDLLKLIASFKQKTTYRSRKAGMTFAWQKDFYDHIIRRNEDYGAQVRYLLRNPVRAGLCVKWQDWPHKGVLGQTWEQLALNIATL